MHISDLNASVCRDAGFVRSERATCTPSSNPGTVSFHVPEDDLFRALLPCPDEQIGCDLSAYLWHKFEQGKGQGFCDPSLPYCSLSRGLGVALQDGWHL